MKKLGLENFFSVFFFHDFGGFDKVKIYISYMDEFRQIVVV